jgi:hypothetical protein
MSEENGLSAFLSVLLKVTYTEGYVLFQLLSFFYYPDLETKKNIQEQG